MLGSSYYNQHIMLLLYIFMIPKNIQLTSNPHSNMFNQTNTRKFTQKKKKKERHGTARHKKTLSRKLKESLVS